MRIVQSLVVVGMFSFAGLALAAPMAAPAKAPMAMAKAPDAAKYPNLSKSWAKLQDAKAHVAAAEKAHEKSGTLGGHGAAAGREIAAAEQEITAAIEFTTAHSKAGAAGKVTQPANAAATADDKKYPNLGDAHVDLEWAIGHVHEAMEYHGPTGTLGGHGEKAEEHMKNAQKEIVLAEQFADAHK